VSVRTITLADVSATYAYDEQPAGGNPLRSGASPASIRAALLGGDRAGFDAAYEAALVESRESLDLTGLFKTLERWRRLAVLQRDLEAYRRMVRRVAQTLTGQESPVDEPLEITRSKAGM
jgi:Family of unknown function (DUF6247)